jgi:hypothetical protein
MASNAEAMMTAAADDRADHAIPQLVRTSKADQNHAAAFDYALVIPNQWAGVTMQIDGQPAEAGALPPDDVSGYKVLSIQAYVTGTSYMRVETMCRPAAGTVIVDNLVFER